MLFLVRKAVLYRACLAFLGTYAGQAYAQDIEWNGFLTTGAAVTDANAPYQKIIHKKASITDETLLGLNLSKNLNDEWRVAAQILSRAGQADGAAKVDWSFVTYKPVQSFDLTLGKQKIPMWMMSAYRDLGRAYPWVEPPEEVYALFPLRSFTGVSFNYALKIGDSLLTINPYGGDVILESAPNAPTSFSKINGANMAGAGLVWTWKKFLARAAYNKALWDLNLSDELQFGERLYDIFSVGIRGEAAGFLFFSEYGETRDLSEKTYDKKAEVVAQQAAEAAAAGDQAEARKLGAQAALYQSRIGGAKAYFVTLARQWGALLPHLTYASLERPQLPQLSRDQRSMALGVNYDITTEAVIKVEAKKVQVPEKSQGLFSAPLDSNDAMVYRLGYSLIF
jgi:hypothetical protein